MWRRSFTSRRVAVAASLFIGMLAASTLSAGAVQTSTMQYEGHYATSGNLSLEQKLTGAWTAFAGCCVLGTPDDSLNIIDANTPLVGALQLIGATGGPGEGVVTPGPPDFDGAELSVFSIDATGVTFQVDFTNADSLNVSWQLVKLVVKQGSHNEGIFVTTALFDATDPIQRAFIPIDQLDAFLADSPGNGGVGVSHFTAFGVAGPPREVPEPATLFLLGLGVVGLGAYGRKQIGT